MEKVREKLVNVDACWECPYSIYHFKWWLFGHYYRCSHRESCCITYCGDGCIIPEWCPLSAPPQVAESVTLRSYNISYEKLPEFFRLYDIFKAAKDGQDYVVKFNLWDFIVQMYPDIINGRWCIKVQDPMHVFIKERSNG